FHVTGVQTCALPIFLHLVIDTAHSRFPVYEGDRENIIGILLAKDLLKLQRSPQLNLRALLRPAVFVPESKGLNDLLREFRGNRKIGRASCRERVEIK